MVADWIHFFTQFRCHSLQLVLCICVFTSVFLSACSKHYDFNACDTYLLSVSMKHTELILKSYTLTSLGLHSDLIYVSTRILLYLCFFLAQLFYPADYCLTYSLTKWKTSNKQTANPYDPNLFLRGQSSLLTGSSLHKKPLYITHGIIVMSPYYVVYTYLRQSMWMHCDALYSPWLSFWKPISWYMLSPWVAALASTNGLTRDKQWDKWAFNSSFVPPWM